MSIPVIPIALPWGDDGVGARFCPVCAADFLGDEPCTHVLFVFLDEAGEFSHVADRIRNLVADLPDADDLEDATLPEVLAERIDCDSAACLVFGATCTGGGASVAIDFATLESVK